MFTFEPYTFSLDATLTITDILPFNSHCYFLPLLLQVPSLEIQLVRRFVNFCRKMYFSNYEVVSYMCRRGLRSNKSTLSRNMYFICNRFNYDLEQLLKGYIVKDSFLHIQKNTCEHLRELLYARDSIVKLQQYGTSSYDKCHVNSVN